MRKFSNRLSLYNIKTGELKENIAIEHAYAIENYYDDEIEKKLNRQVESQFGDLLSNYILKCEREISLSRKQLYLVKKFLLISLLRSIHAEEFMQKEKGLYNTLQSNDIWAPPFEEKQIEGENSFEYWMRTLKVVLDTDGTPQGILEHPDKTYPAYRWATIICNAYLGFWDAPNVEEFVITDIGMTSENEKGWNGITIFNHKKKDFILSCLEKTSNPVEKVRLVELGKCMFYENFQMFPISSKRMIVLINPFFKYRYMKKQSGGNVPPLEELTVIPNEILFEPNRIYYKLPQISQKEPQYHEDDRYIYAVKALSRAEKRYCNALFLDRIDTYLGFSTLDHVVGSIIKYKKLNDPPYTPRVNYTALYKIIQERYKGSLNV